MSKVQNIMERWLAGDWRDQPDGGTLTAIMLAYRAGLMDAVGVCHAWRSDKTALASVALNEVAAQIENLAPVTLPTAREQWLRHGSFRVNTLSGQPLSPAPPAGEPATVSSYEGGGGMGSSWLKDPAPRTRKPAPATEGGVWSADTCECVRKARHSVFCEKCNGTGRAPKEAP